MRRYAIGLWFIGIAALGLMRWWMKVVRENGAADALDAKLWLAGALVFALVGGWMLWRAWRQRVPG